MTMVATNQTQTQIQAQTKTIHNCSMNRTNIANPVTNGNGTDHANNGLITKIWGGPGWTFCHSVTFGYPLHPTEDDKTNFKNFFALLGQILPCKYCRESYKNFITNGETAMTDEAFLNRSTLTKWFYDIHERVNAKLEIDYGVTYDDLVNKYESFRAKCGKVDKQKKGCVAPLDYKAFSFKKLYYTDAPIVHIKMIEPFVRLAQARKIDSLHFSFLNLARALDGNFAALKEQRSWPARNKYCQKCIKYMRENAICSIEQEGKWEGTPTIPELKLLLFLCSNLNRSEIYAAIKTIAEIDF